MLYREDEMDFPWVQFLQPIAATRPEANRIEERPVQIPKNSIDRNKCLAFQVASQLRKHHEAFENEKMEEHKRLDNTQIKQLKPPEKPYPDHLAQRRIQEPKTVSTLAIQLTQVSVANNVDSLTENDDSQVNKNSEFRYLPTVGDDNVENASTVNVSDSSSVSEDHTWLQQMEVEDLIADKEPSSSDLNEECSVVNEEKAVPRTCEIEKPTTQEKPSLSGLDEKQCIDQANIILLDATQAVMDPNKEANADKNPSPCNLDERHNGALMKSTVLEAVIGEPVDKEKHSPSNLDERLCNAKIDSVMHELTEEKQLATGKKQSPNTLKRHNTVNNEGTILGTLQMGEPKAQDRPCSNNVDNTQLAAKTESKLLDRMQGEEQAVKEEKHHLDSFQMRENTVKKDRNQTTHSVTKFNTRPIGSFFQKSGDGKFSLLQGSYNGQTPNAHRMLTSTRSNPRAMQALYEKYGPNDFKSATYEGQVTVEQIMANTQVHKDKQKVQKSKSDMHRSSGSWTVEDLTKYIKASKVNLVFSVKEGHSSSKCENVLRDIKGRIQSNVIAVSRTLLPNKEGRELPKEKQEFTFEYLGLSNINIIYEAKPRDTNIFESDIRLLVDAIIIPICDIMRLRLKTGQGLSAYRHNSTSTNEKILPECWLDYQLFYKDVPIAVIETKRPPELKEKCFAQVVLQLLNHQRQAESPDIPFVGLLTDSYRWVFLILEGNSLTIEQERNTFTSYFEPCSSSGKVQNSSPKLKVHLVKKWNDLFEVIEIFVSAIEKSENIIDEFEKQ